jgi:hypothetical protein
MTRHGSSPTLTPRSTGRAIAARKLPVIGSRTEPAVPARIVYVGGPWNGREEALEPPGDVPTILPADVPLGYYAREALLPHGLWRRAGEGLT